MSYNFNPTPTEASLLVQIAQNESKGNYSAKISQANCTALGYTVCSASGAYQFIDSTWQMATAATGVGTQYASAADAPASVQDINALYMLRAYGPNATITWAASGPYTSIPADGTQPIVDLTDGASTSTADILSSMQSAVDSVDLTSPVTDVMLVLGVAAVAWLATR